MGDLAESIRKDEEKIHAKLCSIAYDLEKEDATKYATVIARMRDGSYLDFGSNLDLPKMEMHTDLMAVGLTDLDKRMQDGEFDT